MQVWLYPAWRGCLLHLLFSRCVSVVCWMRSCWEARAWNDKRPRLRCFLSLLWKLFLFWSSPQRCDRSHYYRKCNAVIVEPFLSLLCVNICLQCLEASTTRMETFYDFFSFSPPVSFTLVAVVVTSPLPQLRRPWVRGVWALCRCPVVFTRTVSHWNLGVYSTDCFCWSAASCWPCSDSAQLEQLQFNPEEQTLDHTYLQHSSLTSVYLMPWRKRLLFSISFFNCWLFLLSLRRRIVFVKAKSLMRKCGKKEMHSFTRIFCISRYIKMAENTAVEHCLFKINETLTHLHHALSFLIFFLSQSFQGFSFSLSPPCFSPPLLLSTPLLQPIGFVVHY